MFKILGAKNRRKNLHKHPGPPLQIRGGPGSFSIARNPTNSTNHKYVVHYVFWLWSLKIGFL